MTTGAGASGRTCSVRASPARTWRTPAASSSVARPNGRARPHSCAKTPIFVVAEPGLMVMIVSVMQCIEIAS